MWRQNNTTAFLNISSFLNHFVIKGLLLCGILSFSYSVQYQFSSSEAGSSLAFVPQDSFRIQLFHESSGSSLSQVNVFNTCDFSSTQSLKNGTIHIALNVGECCDFTFSKANFATREMTLCATPTPTGIQLVEAAAIPPRQDLVQKGGEVLQAPLVYKDVDSKLYLSTDNHQPFTGAYKGQVYKNGSMTAPNFCCAYSTKEVKEDELLDRRLTLVKKGLTKRPSPPLKISLQSKVSLQVKGLVLEEKHEFPIEEAKVILVNQNNQQDRQMQVTNLDGIFDFSLRKNECYQLWVEKDNYTQVGQPIQICTNQSQASQSFEFNIFLK